jgi:hypothetical protein
MMHKMPDNQTMRAGSEEEFRAAVARAARRFEAENPDLDKRLAMTVTYLQLIDFMWVVWRQGRPIGPLSIDDAFQAVMLEFVATTIEPKRFAVAPMPLAEGSA